jgi:hypothetical protein
VVEVLSGTVLGLGIPKLVGQATSGTVACTLARGLLVELGLPVVVVVDCDVVGGSLVVDERSAAGVPEGDDLPAS